MLKFVNTTILGGFVFLLPFVVVVAILGKALSIIHVLATPALQNLTVEHIAGIAVIHIVSVLILVLVCFLGGLWAKTPGASALGSWLDKKLMDSFPPYALIKAKFSSITDPEESGDLTPVMVRFDDSWQIAFEVDVVGDGLAMVFLPGAPDAWSGSICAVEVSRIRPLDTNVKSVSSLMKRLGKGSSDIVQIADRDTGNQTIS